MNRPHKVLLAVSLIAGVGGNLLAQVKTPDDASQSQVSSIGASLRNARSAGQRPVHILYIHGIGATEAGDSRTLQKSICAYLNDCIPKKPTADPVATDYAEGGEFEYGAKPPALEYMGQPVWANSEEWNASAPFVDHYVLRRSQGGPIVVDEINWGPLVFSLKCRQIMAGETELAGPDKTLLNLCSKREKDAHNPIRFRYYPWIDAADATKLEARRPKGALFNRSLKTGLLDWGFSDAIMAVGPMRALFREAMRQLFAKSASFNADGSETNEWERQLTEHGTDREFIVVSHSLGSYLVFSTLEDQKCALPTDAPTPPQSGAATPESATEDRATEYVLERTSLVYFLANQVPLLELATLGRPRPAGSAQTNGPTAPAAAGALSAPMRCWSNLPRTFGDRHVIAFSDPSDLLSWQLPETNGLTMDGLTIENRYVRNALWHWLIARPGVAHIDYAKNKQVLRVMLGPKASGEQR